MTRQGIPVYAWKIEVTRIIILTVALAKLKENQTRLVVKLGGMQTVHTVTGLGKFSLPLKTSKLAGEGNF